MVQFTSVYIEQIFLISIIPFSKTYIDDLEIQDCNVDSPKGVLKQTLTFKTECRKLNCSPNSETSFDDNP